MTANTCIYISKRNNYNQNGKWNFKQINCSKHVKMICRCIENIKTMIIFATVEILTFESHVNHWMALTMKELNK